MDEKQPKRENPIDFIKGLIVELKTIEWPSRARAVQLTMIVIGASLLFGLLIGGFDYLLTLGLEKLLELRG